MLLPLRQLLDISQAADRASLARLLTGAANELGFGLFSGVIIRGEMREGLAPTDYVGNQSGAYTEAMNSLSDALRDPVVSALRAGPAPVLYDQATYVEASVPDLWDQQAPFGYRCGVACSVHEPSHSEQFIFGLDRPDALPKDPVGRLRLTSAVQMLTVHAQAAMQRIFTPAPAGSPVLDDHELECLKWARDGFDYWKVGEKLCISSARVQHHQRSAAKKLGASSTRGAVLRCIQGGLID